jgi:hypothetical protein
MDISVVEAYAKGRMAGVNHSLALYRNPAAKPPASPYSGAAYLAGVEWERGFSDGFAQGERRKSATHHDVERRRAP